LTSKELFAELPMELAIILKLALEPVAIAPLIPSNQALWFVINPMEFVIMPKTALEVDPTALLMSW
jgi:hypothetical protein